MKKTKVLILCIMVYFLLFSIYSYADENVNNNETEYYVSSEKESDITVKESVVDHSKGITDEMCSSDYWKNLTVGDKDAILMTKEEITIENKAIVDGAGTKVYDLENGYDTIFTPKDLRNTIPSLDHDYYVNGVKINREQYFGDLNTAIYDTRYTDPMYSIYAVAVKRADIKSWPTTDVIGYNPTDPDDEMESSALEVNEPFVIRQKCEVNGKRFYWGVSRNCSGWVDGDCLAICSSKTEWFDAWKVDVTENDFIVVTQDKIVLEPSILSAYSSEVKLCIGTILKLVPSDDVPKNIAERGTWNNYVVYLPTRNVDGNYEKKIALISQHHNVSVGFLDLTQSNLLDVTFSCLGNRYGWGGMLDSMDCSLYTRCVYRCFGFEIARNTTAQPKTPNFVTNISSMDEETKEKFIERLPVGSALYFDGHAMIYIGSENGINYAISATGYLVDIGSVELYNTYSVIINPLTVTRKNGNTWLKSLTKVLCFSNNIDLKEYDQKLDDINITPYMFNSTYYADMNKDVRAIYGYNENALKQHYQLYGIKEGREASIIFNPHYYLENNSDLKNVFGNNYEQAYNHFINYGIKEGRKGSKYFDIKYYLDNNIDVKQTYFNNYTYGLKHFVNWGLNEGRNASSEFNFSSFYNNCSEYQKYKLGNDFIKYYILAQGIDIIDENLVDITPYMFNLECYYKCNPDLQTAIGYNENALKQHYQLYGMSEGRTASLIFDAKYYLENNLDVKNAIGEDYEAAYWHFVRYGIFEGRKASKVFDAKYYLDNNEDLSRVFGNNYTKAVNHFIKYGMDEDRDSSSEFNITEYKQNHPELQTEYGNNSEKYIIHFLANGEDE